MLAVLALAGGLAAGCKAKNDADAAPDPAAVKAQQDLLKRRDALLSARQKLAKEKADIDVQIRDGEKAGTDTTDLRKRMAELESKLQSNNDETTKFLQDDLPANLPPPPTNSSSSPSPTQNADLSREIEKLRELEERAAERERQAQAAIASAERTAAEHWKDTCTVGASPVVVQQVSAPKGSNYTKSDVQPLLTKARSTMAKKGIRGDDLGPAGNLEGESTKAMADGDWGKAYLAAAQLAATVDSIKIDKPFIQSKFIRLKAYVDGHKETQTQAQAALSDIAQRYGDNDLVGTNNRINQLWTQLGH